jgi:effector-binding domain-containing protein
MAGVKIKTISAQKLAYLEHIGDYSGIPYDKYFEQLYTWAKKNKVRPGFKPLGIFHNNPEETPPEECRSEVAIPIVGDAESDEEIKVKELPSMEVAIIKHKGSSEEYKNTYKTLENWITENGYDWAGPCMEVYTKKPKVKGNQTIMYATIQAPVKKKGSLLRKLADKED